jgi:hypothetical protein
MMCTWCVLGAHQAALHRETSDKVFWILLDVHVGITCLPAAAVLSCSERGVWCAPCLVTLPELCPHIAPHGHCLTAHTLGTQGYTHSSTMLAACKIQQHP